MTMLDWKQSMSQAKTTYIFADRGCSSVLKIARLFIVTYSRIQFDGDFHLEKKLVESTLNIRREKAFKRSYLKKNLLKTM